MITILEKYGKNWIYKSILPKQRQIKPNMVFSIFFKLKSYHCLHPPILININAFALLKRKITYSAIGMISQELNKAKILVQKFNKQVSFAVSSNEIFVIELD